MRVRLALVVVAAAATGLTGCGSGAARQRDAGAGPDAGGDAPLVPPDGPVGDDGGPGDDAGVDSSGLPPDPSTVAPALEPGVASDFAAGIEFLYSGPNPIQTGVAAGALAFGRVAVLRGRVTGSGGAALGGVQVSVHGHPELGQTLSRVDGRFDLVVNGGGLVTVDYRLPGYLPAQRQVVPPWRDFAFLPDVTLRPLAATSSSFDLSNATTVQSARADSSTDGDGTRRATMLLMPGTAATLQLPDGSTQPLGSLTVRATEYTVGAEGQQAMPGALPPASGYTYALDWAVDEALGAGATTVTFDQPVLHYVENFLGFPVGSPVPTGYYDPQRAAWVAVDDGRVVKILGVTDGLAEIDSTGDGAADNGAALGVTDAERRQLATLYQPGQSLWRVPLPHLSSFDCNWPYGPPSGAAPPSGPPPKPDDPPDLPSCQSGSLIECQSQVLGEEVALAGTPFALHYSSDRAVGRGAAYSLAVPLTGATPPGPLARVDLEVTVAGQQRVQQFTPDASQIATVTWDGKDAYGRPVAGHQRIATRLGYVYNAVYQQPAQLRQSFAALSGVPLSNNPARGELTMWQEWQGMVGTLDGRVNGLGGWTLDIHHAYDPQGKVLYLGDGSRRSLDALGVDVITTVAGGATTSALGDGGAATSAALFGPNGLATGPDGSFLIADLVHHRVRLVAADGTITTLAGTGTAGYNGDGIPAVQAQLNNPAGVALGPDGSVYIADRANFRVRQVTPDGMIATVAGTGASGYSGDGGPATAAQLGEVYGVAVAPDGVLYLADRANRRVRRVALDGTITTFAGNGTIGGGGDGGPATAAQLSGPLRLALGRDGSVYVADNWDFKVRRIGPDGIVSTVAGTGTSGYSGDGGPATAAELRTPVDVAVGPDGAVYVADQDNYRVRKIGTDGTIVTVAGTGAYGFSGDRGRALAAKLYTPDGLAVLPDGTLLIADGTNNRVRRVAPALPGAASGEVTIASADGAELYVFSGAGRHLRTLDALSGATRYTFGYDASFRLASVTDGDGNVTTIERDAAGLPTALVAPHGQRTVLATTADGYLQSITDPAGGTVALEYGAGGLLTGLTRPAGNRYAFTYDDLGRLVKDQDPAGGAKTLARVVGDRGYAVTLATGVGRTAGYSVTVDALGNETRVDTLFSGLQETLVRGVDGTLTQTFPTGLVAVAAPAPDPRWGLQAALAGSETVSTPGGLVSNWTRQRTATLSDPANPFSLTTLVEKVTVNGRQFTDSYTASTRTRVVTSPAGRLYTTVADEQGRVVQEQAGGLFPVSYTYDAAGRLSTISQGSGAATRLFQRTYDAGGYPATDEDPLGEVTSFAWDGAGRLVTLTSPDAQAITMTWDADGNLASLTPSGRPAHALGYTPIDLLATYAPPGASDTTSLSYDVDRELVGELHAGGLSVDLAYDAAGRLATLTTARGTVTTTYDPVTGNRATVTAPGGVDLAFDYDGPLPLGRTWSGPVAGSVTETVDHDFRVTAQSVDGVAVAYTYDADGLVTGAGALTLSRDAQTGLISGSSLGQVTDVRGYDEFGALVSTTTSYAGGAVYALTLARDLLGRVTSRTETLGGTTHTTQYAYDPAGQLLQVTVDGTVTATYTYDANGNRLGDGTVTGATYDSRDRLTQYGSASFAHTPDGARASRTVGGQVTAYQYDVLGNLLGVTLPDGTAISYLVDGFNRRVGKQVNGALARGWLYARGSRPVAELDSGNAVVSRFVYASRADVPEYLVRGGATYRIITDDLGSPRLVVNVATGQVAQRLDYDAFGVVTADSSPGWQPFGFAGGLYDPDTGLVRFGARDYDPAAGRFTAKDPTLFDGQQANLYVYVGNDPVNRTDPTGLGGVSPFYLPSEWAGEIHDLWHDFWYRNDPSSGASGIKLICHLPTKFGAGKGGAAAADKAVELGNEIQDKNNQLFRAGDDCGGRGC